MERIHERRIGKFAFWDLFLTLIAALFIGKFFNYNIILVFLVLICLGIVVHKLTNTRTALNDMIFGSQS